MRTVTRLEVAQKLFKSTDFLDNEGLEGPFLKEATQALSTL